MSEPSHLTWSCPGCGRRVPLRVDSCHCGRMRATAPAEPTALPAHPPRVALPPRQSGGLWRSLPVDVKALALAGILVTVAGVGWALFGPQSTERMPALLGYIEPTPPPPTPRPPTHPPFRLPWWR